MCARTARFLRCTHNARSSNLVYRNAKKSLTGNFLLLNATYKALVFSRPRLGF